MSDLDKLLNGLSEISGAKHKSWRSIDTVEGAQISGSVVPRFWAKGQRIVSAHGKEFRVECIGASAESAFEAMKIADARTDDAAQRLMAAASLYEPGDVGHETPNSFNVGEMRYDKASNRFVKRDPVGSVMRSTGVTGKLINGEWVRDKRYVDSSRYQGASKGTKSKGPAQIAASMGIPGVSTMHQLEPRFRPEPEVIFGEIAVGGRVVAAVTRNHYGAKILNAVNAMFVDIDSGHDVDAIEKNMIMDHVRVWASARPNLSIRAYATKQGVRLLFTGKPYEPASREAQGIMASLNADPRYARLCASQNTFRARLTPKPWRIGISNPPARFPKDPADRRLMASWSNSYEIASIPYATSQFLGTIGTGIIDPLIAPVVTFHDRFAVGYGQLA